MVDLSNLEVCEICGRLSGGLVECHLCTRKICAECRCWWGMSSIEEAPRVCETCGDTEEFSKLEKKAQQIEQEYLLKGIKDLKGKFANKYKK